MKTKIILITAMLMLLFSNITAKDNPNPFRMAGEETPATEQTPVIEQAEEPKGAGETGTAGDDTLVTFYRAGMGISGTVNNLDSGVTRYTAWFDPTLFDGVTKYFTGTFVSDSTTADTMRAIFEGRDGKVPSLTMKMDTILIVGSAGTITQTAISQNTYFPEWRIILEPYSTNEGDDGYIRWSIYAPTNDTVPPKLNLGNY